MSNVAKIMDYYAAKISGKLGLGYKNFTTGEEHYVCGDERFPAASAFKVPVLIELFAQVEAGKISLTDMYTMKAEDVSPGSGVLSSMQPGLTLSVLDYATLMMMVSDNTGTDITYRMLGRENIRARIDAMGLENTRSDLTCKELILGLYKNIPLDLPRDEYKKLFEQGEPERDDTLYTNMDVPNDISSPKDTIKMYSLIYNKEILTPKSCQHMMDIMAACHTNSRIPYHLPFKGPNEATVMHKTGTLKNVAVDAGIVKTASQTYAVAFFYNGYNATPEEQETPHFKDYLLADLSKEIFDELHK